jgi:5-methylcytosine-specific restriction enzyme A
MLASHQLIEGNIYTRKELRQIFNITDATINNGVFKLSEYQSIWLFITEQKTTSHPPLQDLLEGEILYWDGQPEGRTDKDIIGHARNGWELLVFYRKSRNEFPGSGFKYHGRFCYSSHSGARPTNFILKHYNENLAVAIRDIEALQIEESYAEGKLTTILINKHERNPQLRSAAIQAHGTYCQACRFSFAEMYGAHGEGFIEVHHLKPVSKYVGEINVSPSEDMATLCANCHRMVHRKPEKPLSLEELRQIINSNHKP